MNNGVLAFTQFMEAVKDPKEGVVNIGNTLMFREALNLVIKISQTDFSFGKEIYFDSIKLNFHRNDQFSEELIKPEDIVEIFLLLQNGQIRHLDLDNGNVDDNIGKVLLELVKTHPNIRKVTLTNNPHLSKELYEEIMGSVNSIENMIASFNVMTISRVETLQQMLNVPLKAGCTRNDLKERYFQEEKEAFERTDSIRKNMCYLPGELQRVILAKNACFAPNEEELAQREKYICDTLKKKFN